MIKLGVSTWNLFRGGGNGNNQNTLKKMASSQSFQTMAMQPLNWRCSLLAKSPATASYRNSNTRPSDNKVDIMSSHGFQGSNIIVCIDNFVGKLNWYICFYIAPEGLVLAGWIGAVVNWTPLASNTLCLCSLTCHPASAVVTASNGQRTRIVDSEYVGKYLYVDISPVVGSTSCWLGLFSFCWLLSDSQLLSTKLHGLPCIFTVLVLISYITPHKHV